MTQPDERYTQTAFVVRDVEAAAARWTEATGAGPWFVLEPETRGTIYRGRPGADRYRLVMGFLGASLIELIAPMDDEPSILNEVLAERGEGFHHVSPRMSGLSGESFDAACRALEGRGLAVASSTEVVGVGRAVFYDATALIGGLIEVFELGEGVSALALMARAHVGWDGSDPVRPYASMFEPA